MARLKEEGEHFKPLQSTRGHFQAMSERLCPSRGILSLTEGKSSFVFFRTQHPLLLPYDQRNQPRNAWTNNIDPSAGHSQNATQAQLQPSAPPSPSFTLLFHLQLLPLLFHIQCHREFFHHPAITLPPLV